MRSRGTLPELQVYRSWLGVTTVTIWVFMSNFINISLIKKCSMNVFIFINKSNIPNQPLTGLRASKHDTRGGAVQCQTKHDCLLSVWMPSLCICTKGIMHRIRIQDTKIQYDWLPNRNEGLSPLGPYWKSNHIVDSRIWTLSHCSFFSICTLMRPQ